MASEWKVQVEVFETEVRLARNDEVVMGVNYVSNVFGTYFVTNSRFIVNGLNDALQMVAEKYGEEVPEKTVDELKAAIMRAGKSRVAQTMAMMLR